MRETVLVTGICGGLGQLLAKRLHRKYLVSGIDRRHVEGWPKDITVYEYDIRRKKCEEVFREHRIKAVFHLGVMHDPRKKTEEHHSFNVAGTAQLLDYCVRYKVPKFIFLSSASVYGARPANDNFLTEDAPLMGAASFAEISDLIELDMLIQGFFWKHPEVETVILRPVHIVGPHVKNAPTKFMRMKRPWLLLGFSPMLQLIFEEDVATALILAMKPKASGVYNVAGPGEIPITTLVREMGRRPIYVPHFMAKRLVGLLWDWRASSFPAPEVDHLRYHCMVDDSRCRRELGFAPKHSFRRIFRLMRAAAAGR